MVNVGKIIDNFNCYIATVSSSEEAKNAQVGKKITIRLSNNSEVIAEIISANKNEKDEVLLILKFTKEIEELINYRKISCDLIWWSASGLKIPNQSIVEQDGLNYVVRNRAGYLSKLLVNVTEKGEKYSIVEPYTNEKLKEFGYTSDKIINYKKITLYDEILLRPDLSKIE